MNARISLKRPITVKAWRCFGEDYTVQVKVLVGDYYSAGKISGVDGAVINAHTGETYSKEGRRDIHYLGQPMKSQDNCHTYHDSVDEDAAAWRKAEEFYVSLANRRSQHITFPDPSIIDAVAPEDV